MVDYSTTINHFTLLVAYPQVVQAKYKSWLHLYSTYHQIPLIEEGFIQLWRYGGQLYQYKQPPFGITNGVSTFPQAIDCFINKYILKNVYEYVDDLTITDET